MPFQHEIIDLSRKPAEFLDLYGRSGRAGSAKVPLLELDGEVIVESIDIARRVARLPGGESLLPPDGASRVDAFVRLWTGRVEGAYYDVLSAPSEPAAGLATSALVATLVQVEDALRDRADGAAACGPFLLGGTFSLAEAVAAPWCERMLRMLPHWRAIDTPSLCERHGLLLTREWLLATAARPSVVQSSAGDVEMARAAALYYVSHVSPGAAGRL